MENGFGKSANSIKIPRSIGYTQEKISALQRENERLQEQIALIAVGYSQVGREL